MPELPEVETTVRGLAKFLDGARIERVTLNRPDLRRPFPEDLVQVTFSKIHRARESYMRGAPLLPWVLAIARRSFLDERRRAKVRPEDLTGDGIVPEPKQEEDKEE